MSNLMPFPGMSAVCETVLGLYVMELVVDNQNRSNSGLKPFQF